MAHSYADSIRIGIQNLGVDDFSGYSGNIHQVMDQVLNRIKLQEDEIAETNRFLDNLVAYFNNLKLNLLMIFHVSIF